MSLGDGGRKGSTESRDRPADPTFRLRSEYRRRLSRLSHAQYEATTRGNRRRAERLRSRLVEGTPLGAGVGRIVYRLPERAYAGGRDDGYALKLPVPDRHDRYGHDRNGRAQNRAEAGLWERRPSRLLVPIVAADRRGQWLIMPLSESVEPDADRLRTVAERVAETYGLSGTRGQDITAENVVRLDGRLRLCDYGTLS